VRLLERLSLDDPPTDRQFAECRGSIAEFFRREVEPGLKPALRQAREQADGRGVELVGTGGTASVLGCMEAGLESFNRELLEATTLTTERVAWHAARLWALPLEERRKLPGLPKNRADVILTGVAIYLTVIKETGFAKLHVTTRGLRFAALL
jgi:exopolyphosphatase/guanosine-5'-triphosphate,3'-diphosphate pyrophosphatase